MNYLASESALADRVEYGRLIEDLLQHEGWKVLTEMAGVVADRGEKRLQKLAVDTALTIDLQKRIDFARSQGVQDAVSFFPDIAQSIVLSAKTAAKELRADAEKAEAGGQS